MRPEAFSSNNWTPLIMPLLRLRLRADQKYLKGEQITPASINIQRSMLLSGKKTEQTLATQPPLESMQVRIKGERSP